MSYLIFIICSFSLILNFFVNKINKKKFAEIFKIKVYLYFGILFFNFDIFLKNSFFKEFQIP